MATPTAHWMEAIEQAIAFDPQEQVPLSAICRTVNRTPFVTDRLEVPSRSSDVFLATFQSGCEVVNSVQV